MRARLLVFLVVAAVVLVEVDVARSLSATCDEALDLATGVSELERGRVELFLERPPLARRLAGPGPFLLGAREGPAALALREAALPSYGLQYHWADRLVYEDNARLEAPRLFLAARVPFLVFPVVLLVATFAWARALFGTRGGLLALLVVATWPDALGHLVTAPQDGPLSALAMATAYAIHRGPHRGVLLGVLAGLLVAAKLTAVFLAPGFALAALAILREREVALRRIVLGAAVAAAVALAVLSLLWLGAEPVSSVARALRTISRIHRPLEMGPMAQGSPLAFARMLLLKAPPGTLALLALAAWVGIARGGRAGRASEVLLHLPAIVAFAAISLLADPNGTRYVLAPVVLLLVTTGRLARWAQGSRGRVALVALLIGWNAGSAAGRHPFHANATNALAGRPEEAWRVLEDSNVDWGGGLLALARWQRERAVASITVVPFGVNFERRPDRSFSFETLPWMVHVERWGVRGGPARLDALLQPERGRVYAVSAMALHRALALEREAGRPLVLGRLVPPGEVVGGFVIFDLR